MGIVFRRIIALLVGFVVVVVLSLGTDAILHATGFYPPWGQAMSDKLFGFALAYRTVYSIFGSYLTARLAPDHPMRLAMIGGGIGLILCIAGAAATWNRGPEFGPHWYPVVLAITAIPCAWIGGKFGAGRASPPN